MSSDPSAAVTTSGLTRRFGAVTAVDRLDLTVPRGSIFGMLGSNGAGKTTLLRMLVTLLPPSQGLALVMGHDVARAPRAVRQAIGYVSQALSADGALTGRENLTLSARLYALSGAARREAVEEALAFMDLGEAADRLVQHYSGGMIRRLEIAQAMLHRPAVLFLDEPTVGLDPVARHAVWDRVRGLRDRFGTTVIITTHDMDEAERLCERIAILAHGRLSVLGSPAELKAGLGEGATLEDVFVRHTGQAQDLVAGFASTRTTRRSSERLR